MAERIKRSHYLSRFYLAGFTVSGAPDGELCVLDRQRGKSWQSKPANSAIEKSFYAVDLPGEDPDVTEKILAMLEGEYSDVLRWVVANQRLPEGADFDWFLNFVGLMGVRTPHMRNVVGRVVDGEMKARFRELFSTREGWKRFREDLAQIGRQVPDQEYEEYRRFAESEDYEINLDQTTHVRTMVMELMDAILAELAHRHWSLGIAAPGAPDFITSSTPLAVYPGRGFDLTQPITPRSPNTILSFPLTKRLVALARHEPRPPVLGIEGPGVALCNTWTLSNANYVFSPEEDGAAASRELLFYEKLRRAVILWPLGQRLNHEEMWKGKNYGGHALVSRSSLETAA
jgi:hypothetical protein